MAQTQYPTYYAASDLAVYSVKENQWGVPPGNGDSWTVGASTLHPVLYKEQTEDATTTTVRTNEEINEYSGTAVDQTDDIEIGHSCETSISMVWRNIGLTAEALGSICGAGRAMTGVGPSAGEASDTVSGSAAPYAHALAVATAFNREGTHTLYHDTGDHNNVMQISGATLKSYGLSFSPQQTIKCSMAFDGRTELAPYDGHYRPMSILSSKLKKIASDSGYQSGPYPSSLMKFMLQGSSGKYGSFQVESGDITIERATEVLLGSAADSMTVPTTLDITGLTAVLTVTGAATYTYFVTVVNQNGVESLAATVTTSAGHVIDGTHGSTLANIPDIAGLSNTAAINVYRTANGGTNAGPAYLVSTIFDGGNVQTWDNGTGTMAYQGLPFTGFVDTETDANLVANPLYFTGNLVAPGCISWKDAKDINSMSLHFSFNLVVEYNGMSAGSMWQDYRDYNKGGTSSLPTIFGMKDNLGYGFKLSTYETVLDTFALDRSGSRVKGQIAGHALADRNQAVANAVNSKLAATIYSPQSRLLIW